MKPVCSPCCCWQRFDPPDRVQHHGRCRQDVKGRRKVEEGQDCKGRQSADTLARRPLPDKEEQGTDTCGQERSQFRFASAGLRGRADR